MHIASYRSVSHEFIVKEQPEGTIKLTFIIIFEPGRMKLIEHSWIFKKLNDNNEKMFADVTSDNVCLSKIVKLP